MANLTIGPTEIFRQFMHWRSLGHCALHAYIHTFNRRPEIALVCFPDPRRPQARRHWQPAIEWDNAKTRAVMNRPAVCVTR